MTNRIAAGLVQAIPRNGAEARHVYNFARGAVVSDLKNRSPHTLTVWPADDRHMNVGKIVALIEASRTNR